MTRDEAITILNAAGFTVTPHGENWRVTPPPDPQQPRLERESAVIWEWVMIAVAKAVRHRLTPEYRWQQASRWN